MPGRSATAGPRGPVTVAFDLDMTLIDSRPGIRATYELLARETGTYIDCDLVISRIGPPLTEELAHWFPADQVPRLADRYRQLYVEHGITPTLLMPGVREALDAVAARGGRTMVITAKHEPNARLHLDHLQVPVDVVVGDLWAEAKARAVREHEAAVLVGDHAGDMRGARSAGVLGVGVLTGPCAAEELRAAGADVVLDDLRAFPDWLATH